MQSNQITVPSVCYFVFLYAFNSLLLRHTEHLMLPAELTRETATQRYR